MQIYICGLNLHLIAYQTQLGLAWSYYSQIIMNTDYMDPSQWLITDDAARNILGKW